MMICIWCNKEYQIPADGKQLEIRCHKGVLSVCGRCFARIFRTVKKTPGLNYYMERIWAHKIRLRIWKAKRRKA